MNLGYFCDYFGFPYHRIDLQHLSLECKIVLESSLLISWRQGHQPRSVKKQVPNLHGIFMVKMEETNGNSPHHKKGPASILQLPHSS